MSPATSFTGGTVGNAPAANAGLIQVNGGPGAGTNTITFSQAVVNPVMAIYSLGGTRTPTELDFNAPFNIVAGGRRNGGAGSSITSSGNTVFGAEGNGTIQFIGTYTSISWNEPTQEDWTAITFGVPEIAVAAVPESESDALMLAGLGAVGMFTRRRKQA